MYLQSPYWGGSASTLYPQCPYAGRHCNYIVPALPWGTAGTMYLGNSGTLYPVTQVQCISEWLDASKQSISEWLDGFEQCISKWPIDPTALIGRTHPAIQK